MKYIFDTNAFYYYLMARHNLQLPSLFINEQIDKNKFLQFVDSNQGNFLLSAVSILELTTRFRNNPSVIVNAMHFCETDKIQICSNALFNLSPKILGGLANLKANTALAERYITENFVPQRAKIESWFLSNIIIYCAVLFLQLQIHNPKFLKKISNKISINSLEITYLAQIVSIIFPQLIDLARSTDEYLFATLQQSSNLEKIIKKQFEVTLYNSLCFINSELKKIKLHTTDNLEIDCSQIFDETIIHKIESCHLKGETIMPKLNKLAVKLNITPDHSLLTKLMQTRGFTELQLKYFQLLINDWFKNGRKMHKNDINDFLFVGFINQHELGITFDKKVCNFLSQNHLAYDFTQMN